MTTTPEQDTPQEMPFWAGLHQNLSAFGHAIVSYLPKLARLAEAAAANPAVDELIEAALEAEGLGVAAETFAASADVLRQANARIQAPPLTGEPSFTPVQADGTGAQPVQAVV